jgi:hypothetical protein
VNSAAQEEMAKGGIEGSHNMTEEERAEAAHMMWNHEKGTAAGIIILSWLVKVCNLIHTNSRPDWTNACGNRSTLHSWYIHTLPISAKGHIAPFLTPVPLVAAQAPQTQFRTRIVQSQMRTRTSKIFTVFLYGHRRRGAGGLQVALSPISQIS